MFSGPKWLRSAIVLSISAVSLSGAYLYATAAHHTVARPDSAKGLLQRANELSWNNRWTAAQPLYARSEKLFLAKGDLAKALFAEVSQEPPREAVSVRSRILKLDQEIRLPAADDPETRLRILNIRGMLETNYDAAEARATWQQVRSLALSLHHFELASRAEGEQGIAAFILGDTGTAEREVIAAWALAKVERDYAGIVRYGSMFGAGLVEMGRYKEAMTPINQAIRLTVEHPEIAYPTIAIYAKIDALAGLHQYSDALALANESLEKLSGTGYAGHEAAVLLSRGSIFGAQGNWNAAVADYAQVVRVSQQMGNYRGIADGGGLLAQAYEHTGDLHAALAAIDTALDANTHVPDELYLAPRNLAIKAEIVAASGDTSRSDRLYRKSLILVDVMLQHASTTNIQRHLLSEMSDVYSEYFAFLSHEGRFDRALTALEQVRGRVETEALLHHASEPVHVPTPAERELTRLNIVLINTDDPKTRETLNSAIYDTELRVNPSQLTHLTITHPVQLRDLQSDLAPSALIIEYVLAEPHSYVLAITRSSIRAYELPPKVAIEADANRYRKEIRAQKEDKALAHRIFTEVLGPVREYTDKNDLIVIPDGSLHLLPFSALVDDTGYLLRHHTVDVEPSSTVFDLLSKRASPQQRLPADRYIGVAAWTQTADVRSPIVRAIEGPERAELVPLPESKTEVESIAEDLPGPSTILLGSEATETRFKQISPMGTDVIHLALHGYADLDYPERSALVFAPDPSSTDDGLLQIPEIRALHLRAKLVTLSACDTGVGPVGEADVDNLVNAFIEAGAQSVVSTLWELEDHSTSRLMQSFYAQLAKHNRKVNALRSAQEDLLDQGLPPYYWASFQMVGEPNGTV